MLYAPKCVTIFLWPEYTRSSFHHLVPRRLHLHYVYLQPDLPHLEVPNLKYRLESLHLN